MDRALEAIPSLTVEGLPNESGCIEPERRRVVETMRLAGFPLCAKPEALAGIASPLRLPECQ